MPLARLRLLPRLLAAVLVPAVAALVVAPSAWADGNSPGSVTTTATATTTTVGPSPSTSDNGPTVTSNGTPSDTSATTVPQISGGPVPSTTPSGTTTTLRPTTTRPGQTTTTTTPHPIVVPPPPPNPSALLAELAATQNRFTALATYQQAMATVQGDQVTASQAQAQVTQAAIRVQEAKAQEQQALADVLRAQGSVRTAKHHLAAIAVAEYTDTEAADPTLAGQDASEQSAVLFGAAADSENQQYHLAVGSVHSSTKAVQRVEQAYKAALGDDTSAGASLSAAQAQLRSAQSAQKTALQVATGVLDAPVPTLADNNAASPASTAAPTTMPKAGPRPSTASSTTTTNPLLSRANLDTLGPTVLGPSLLSASEMAGWFTSTGAVANTTVPIQQLAAAYLQAGQSTGVRGDIAFAQSIVETGYFTFPAGGQLTGADNNFAGIGACDSCNHGWSFPDALTGVTAQEQLLEAYASPTPVSTPLVGSVGVGGCCTTWMGLSGTWASNTAYGFEILSVYEDMLQWALQQRLQTAGLVPAGPAAPATVTAASTTPAPGG
jgi:hypothetical protein